MKFLNYLLIALVLTIPCFAQKTNQTIKVSASAAELSILDEINAARTNPQIYASYLEEYKKMIKGNIVYFPNGTRMATIEGIDTVNEAIKFLKKQPKLEPIQFSGGLAKSANLQMNDLFENASLGHRGKDGSDLAKRVGRFGLLGSMFSESIIFYVQSPRDIILTMIIDDGIRSRGDRRNIFSDKFKQIGIAYGSNQKAESFCVAVFTDSFQERNVSMNSVRTF